MVETEKKYCTPTCKYDRGDEDTDKMINYDICEGQYHLSCIELNEKEALELSFWVCRSCKDSHLLVKSLKADAEDETADSGAFTCFGRRHIQSAYETKFSIFWYERA